MAKKWTPSEGKGLAQGCTAIRTAPGLRFRPLWASVLLSTRLPAKGTVPTAGSLLWELQLCVHVLSA